MDAALAGFLGALVGAGASVLTTWVTNRHELKRQRQADSLERQERARAFQRQNLLELQDALADHTRFHGRAMHEDRMAFRKTGEWGKALLTDEVDEGCRASGAKLLALNERVADDDVRAGVNCLMDHLTRYQLSRSEVEAMAVLNQAIELYRPLMQQVGVVLRSLY